MAERVPRIRRAPLPADALIVVRGDDLIEGSSGFYARNDSDVDDLAGDQLERFPLLRLLPITTSETTRTMTRADRGGG